MKSKKDFKVRLTKGFSFAEKLSAKYRLIYKKAGTNRRFSFVTDDSETKELFQNKHAYNPRRPAFGSDGQTVYFGEGQVCAINIFSGEKRTLTNFENDKTFHSIWMIKCSPDGKKLIFIDDVVDKTLGRSACWRVCSINTDGSDLKILFEKEKWSILEVCVNWVQGFAVFSANKYLLKVDLNTNKIDENAWVMPDGILGFDLSPVDNKIACFGDNYKLSMGSLNDDKLIAFNNVKGTRPVWSPDGKYLAFIKDDYELWVWDEERFVVKRILAVEGRNFPFERWKRIHLLCPPAWSPDGRLLWFTVRKNRHLRKLKDFHINTAKGHFTSLEELKEKYSEEEVKMFEHMHRWTHQEKVGIVDFKTQEVWLKNGSWEDVVFSPAGEKDIF